MPAISDVTAHVVREPVSKREYVLVTLRTDAGVTGIGEASGADPASLVAAVLDQKKVLAGRDPTAVETLPPSPVRGAVAMACLDITGKLAKAPLYEVLGGPTRHKIRAATRLSSPEAVSPLRAAGFRAAFLPLPPPPYRNQGQAWVKGIRRRLDQLRQAAGDDFDFVLDCDGALTPGDAQMLAKEVETFHVLWLDEPCSLVNLQAAAKISGESVTPVGFGRHVTHNHQFQELLGLDAIDILRPPLSLGINSIRKAAALAETYYVAVAPFHRGGPVATAAAQHLAASLPNFFLQEVSFPEAEADRRMRAELVSMPVESVRDGYFALPPGPGLGIALNPDALQKYRAV
jgi:galactonate dehydratase